MARCTRDGAPRATGHWAPWPTVRFKWGACARARPPRGSPATTGVVGHARARERGHSTRKARAHQVEAAPPLRGHRRRRPRQWRAVVPHRNHGGRERRPRRLHGTKTRGKKSGRCACSPRRRSRARRGEGRLVGAGIGEEAARWCSR